MFEIIAFSSTFSTGCDRSKKMLGSEWWLLDS